MQFTIEPITGHTRSFTFHGQLVGRTHQITTPEGRLLTVAEAHDWEGEHPSGDPYDPICVGTYDDPAQAEREIEDRAINYANKEAVIDSGA